MMCCMSEGEEPVVFSYSVGAGSRKKYNLVCAAQDLGLRMGDAVVLCCKRTKSGEGRAQGFMRYVSKGWAGP